MEDQMASYTKGKVLPGRICGCVVDVGLSATEKCENPIVNASVELFCVDPATATPAVPPDQCVRTDEDGQFEFCDLNPGNYWLRCGACSPEPKCIETTVNTGCIAQVCFEIPLG